MSVRSSLPLAALAAVGIVIAGLQQRDLDPVPAAISDSARAELRIERYWHAARLLRSEGAADGTPNDVFLLAAAEAGWENWAGVLDLLEDADWVGGSGADSAAYLLGRALEHAERWTDAAEAYETYAERVRSEGGMEAAALARRARVLFEAGEADDAAATLGRLVGWPELRSWMAVELLFGAAEAGDTSSVRVLLIHAVEPSAQSAIWRVEADARLAAADTAGAIASFRELVAASQEGRRAEASVQLGRLLLSAGDSTGAQPLLVEAFQSGAETVRALAAASLIDLGGADQALTIELARTVDRVGDGARALLAYDRAAEMARAEGGRLPEGARLERARLMATVEPRQAEALEEFRALRDSTTSDRIGARTLDVWRALRARQGESAAVATLRDWLLRDYPESQEAIELAWSEGANADVNGRLDTALARYAFVGEHGGSSARAGESRMRSGHIHLRRDNLRGAADVFQAYLAEFPEGRRWQEAAYWAGRVLLELGDSAQGRAYLERAMREQPVEYYAVLAAELLDVPYAIDLPEGEGASEPLWLAEGLARLDLLREAGLDRGVDSEVARLRVRARGSRPAMLSLAEALIERGRTVEGINIGWALLEQSGGWDRQILRVAYPFPYRELVRREAAEWGVDPILMAAIIRQESAFSAAVVSRAGAVGLMQVMPPTGAQLARAHGPRPFIEEALVRPEVNLHLGAAFFVDMRRRYDDDLGLVLSAYNAGPTRATRWRSYPEASDPHRFTERIPIEETRGYVKSVRRNLGLYRVLYGAE